MLFAATTDSAKPLKEPVSPTALSSGGTPNYTVPFFQRTDWLGFGITALVALTVYLSTLAPDVTLENSGVLVTGAAYAGVPWPAGFPVWTIYSWLFVHLLPFSNMAWRVAAGSAVASSLSCGLVALMVSRGGAMLLENTSSFSCWNPAEQRLLRVVCGFVAGMALGLSEPVWRKAVIADIFSVTLLLFTILLSLVMRWTAAPEARKYLYRAFFVLGLQLTGSQEFVVMTPALVLLVVLTNTKLGRDLFLLISVLAGLARMAGGFRLLPWFVCYTSRNLPLLFAFLPAAVSTLIIIIVTRRIGSEWKPATRCILWFFIGLAWSFFVPIASMMNPPINWGYPRTVEGFLHVMGRGQYEIASPTRDFGRFLVQLWMLAKDTSSGFGWFYFLFIPLPVFSLWRASRIARNWIFSFFMVFLCVGPLMVVTLNPSDEHQSLQLTRPYYAAMYAVLAVWTGLGLIAFANLVSKPPVRPPPPKHSI
jgi:hypothetical protein